MVHTYLGEYQNRDLGGFKGEYAIFEGGALGVVDHYFYVCVCVGGSNLNLISVCFYWSSTGYSL